MVKFLVQHFRPENILFNAENSRSPEQLLTIKHKYIRSAFPRLRNTSCRLCWVSVTLFGTCKVRCWCHQESSSYCSWCTRESEWPLLEKLPLNRLRITLEAVSLFLEVRLYQYPVGYHARIQTYCREQYTHPSVFSVRYQYRNKDFNFEPHQWLVFCDWLTPFN